MSHIYIDGERQNKIFARANPDIEGHGQISQLWQAGRRVFLEAADIDIQPSEQGVTVPAAGEKFYIDLGTLGTITAYPNTETNVRYRFDEWFRADRNGENRQSFGQSNPLTINGNITWREYDMPQLIPTYKGQYRMIGSFEGSGTVQPNGERWVDGGTSTTMIIRAIQAGGRFNRVVSIDLYDSEEDRWVENRWIGELQNPTQSLDFEVPMPIVLTHETYRISGEEWGNVGDTWTWKDPSDGTEYAIVKMPDNKWWFAESFKKVTPESTIYGNNPDYGAEYGRLYPFSEAVANVPVDCHLPTPADWEELFDAVGGYETAGTKLKSTTLWEDDGFTPQGTDEYGFTLKPAGLLNADLLDYQNLGISTGVWTDNVSGMELADCAMVECTSEDARVVPTSENHKYSVRYIVDMFTIENDPVRSNRFHVKFSEYVPLEIVTVPQGAGAISDASRNVDFNVETSINTHATDPGNQTWRCTKVDRLDDNGNVLEVFETFTDANNPVKNFDLVTTPNTTWRTPNNLLRFSYQEYIDLEVGSICRHPATQNDITGQVNSTWSGPTDLSTLVDVSAEVEDAPAGRNYRLVGFSIGNESTSGTTTTHNFIQEYDLQDPVTSGSVSHVLTTAQRAPENKLRAVFAEWVHVENQTATNGSITAGGDRNYDVGEVFTCTLAPSSPVNQDWRAEKLERVDGEGNVLQVVAQRGSASTDFTNTPWTIPSVIVTEDWREGAFLKPTFVRYVMIQRSAPSAGSQYVSVTGGNVNTRVGDSVTFSVSILTPAAISAVQWQTSTNGTSWTTVAGVIGNTYTHVATEPMFVRPLITMNRFTITINTNPSQGWTRSPSHTGAGTYDYGTQQTVTAGADGQYPVPVWGSRTLRFGSWNGAISGAGRSHTYHVTGNYSPTANYIC